MVLGLGNPGDTYAQTRHNLGFMVVGAWAERHGLHWGRGGTSTRGFQSVWGQARVQGRKVVAALPQTYMNRCGQAARRIVDYFGLTPGDLVVVHDDLDLPLGRLKVAVKGGAAGHKGVLSIMEHLGSDGFTRLKAGIGRPRYGETVEDYVLGGFYADERGTVQDVLDKAADCLEAILVSGPEAAMQKFHRDT